MTLEVDQRVGVEKEDKEQQEEEEHDDVVVEGGRSKRKRKLYNMAMELLTSERAYVARLHLVDKVWLKNKQTTTHTICLIHNFQNVICEF